MLLLSDASKPIRRQERTYKKSHTQSRRCKYRSLGKSNISKQKSETGGKEELKFAHITITYDPRVT